MCVCSVNYYFSFLVEREMLVSRSVSPKWFRVCEEIRLPNSVSEREESMMIVIGKGERDEGKWCVCVFYIFGV